jgi:hypothetical protein
VKATSPPPPLPPSSTGIAIDGIFVVVAGVILVDPAIGNP